MGGLPANLQAVCWLITAAAVVAMLLYLVPEE